MQYTEENADISKIRVLRYNLFEANVPGLGIILGRPGFFFFFLFVPVNIICNVSQVG